MSDVMMAKEQSDFIHNLKKDMLEATNMSYDDALEFAFRVWQCKGIVARYVTMEQAASSKAHWIIRRPKGKEKQEKPYCYHEDKCSHCGRVFCYDYRDQYDACEDFDFCPKCGARMEYPDESEVQP